MDIPTPVDVFLYRQELYLPHLPALKEIASQPEPAQAFQPGQRRLELIDILQFQQTPEEEFRSRIKALEGQLAQLGDFFARHAVRGKGRPLIGKVGEICGHGAVLGDIVIQICAGKRGKGMKIGNIRIQLAGKFNGLEAVRICLARNTEQKRGVDR